MFICRAIICIYKGVCLRLRSWVKNGLLIFWSKLFMIFCFKVFSVSNFVGYLICQKLHWKLQQNSKWYVPKSTLFWKKVPSCCCTQSIYLEHTHSKTMNDYCIMTRKLVKQKETCEKNVEILTKGWQQVIVISIIKLKTLGDWWNK